MKEKRVDGKMKLTLTKGDIAEIEAEALVNAANNHLWMGSGVAGALKRRGGKTIEEEAIEKGPIEHGGAVATTAGKLKAKYVIHAAAMRNDGYITEKSLQNSVLNSLKLAEKYELKTIAFPAIGTGVAGFPIDVCAKLMVTTLRNFDYKSLEEIIIVLYTKDAYDFFKKELGRKIIEW
jgi:O-acetyl-ADP-ribose deacetylase (regulator of RNase III)